MGREKYSLVQIPLRTKVSTGRPFRDGKSPSMSMMQMSNEERYQDTLKEMKSMLHERVKDNKKQDQGSSAKKGKGILPAI